MAEQDGLTTVVMMFHSSELMPGGSPYRPTHRSVTDLRVTLDEFFHYAMNSGGTSVTMQEGARRVMAATVLARRPI